MKTSQNASKLYGLIGIIGAFIVGIGEFYLHFSKQVLAISESYGFFQYVSTEHLYLGHFIAIIGIPMYFVGYIHIYLMLKSGNKNLAKLIIFLGFVAFSVGGVWVGSRAFLGNIVHFKDQIPINTYKAILDNYTNLLESLVNVLRIVILLLSIFFTTAILIGNTFYQKWMALFNPLVILLLFLSTLLIPSLGKFIVPILMNITHFVWFGLSLYNLKLYENN